MQKLGASNLTRENVASHLQVINRCPFSMSNFSSKPLNQKIYIAFDKRLSSLEKETYIFNFMIQKYRSAIRKNDQTQPTSHIDFKEPNTVRSYALNEFNLQTSASSGQLPYQSFSAQVAGQETQNSIDHSNNFDSGIIG